jgi:hypothetical protein
MLHVNVPVSFETESTSVHAADYLGPVYVNASHCPPQIEHRPQLLNMPKLQHQLVAGRPGGIRIYCLDPAVVHD